MTFELGEFKTTFCSALVTIVKTTYWFGNYDSVKSFSKPQNPVYLRISGIDRKTKSVHCVDFDLQLVSIVRNMTQAEKKREFLF